MDVEKVVVSGITIHGGHAMVIDRRTPSHGGLTAEDLDELNNESMKHHILMKTHPYSMQHARPIGSGDHQVTGSDGRPKGSGDHRVTGSEGGRTASTSKPGEFYEDYDLGTNAAAANRVNMERAIRAMRSAIKETDILNEKRGTSAMKDGMQTLSTFGISLHNKMQKSTMNGAYFMWNMDDKEISHVDRENSIPGCEGRKVSPEFSKIKRLVAQRGVQTVEIAEKGLVFFVDRPKRVKIEPKLPRVDEELEATDQQAIGTELPKLEPGDEAGWFPASREGSAGRKVVALVNGRTITPFLFRDEVEDGKSVQEAKDRTAERIEFLRQKLANVQDQEEAATNKAAELESVKQRIYQVQRQADMAHARAKEAVYFDHSANKILAYMQKPMHSLPNWAKDRKLGRLDIGMFVETLALNNEQRKKVARMQNHASQVFQDLQYQSRQRYQAHNQRMRAQYDRSIASGLYHHAFSRQCSNIGLLKPMNPRSCMYSAYSSRFTAAVGFVLATGRSLQCSRT